MLKRIFVLTHKNSVKTPSIYIFQFIVIATSLEAIFSYWW